VPDELINGFEVESVMRCVYRAKRSARATADVVERSHLVVARSRQLLREQVEHRAARALEMDREAELQRLAVADRQIADAERAITKQAIELERLRRDGLETELAEKTLQGFQNVLQTMRKHREEIVTTIAQIDQGLI
jgi:hypothetical protein